MSEKEAHRAELDSLRSEWREALLAARAALRAEEDVLPPAELLAHERRLRRDYRTAAEDLRQFARDEGLSAELAEPFLPRGLAHRALGLPKLVRACVFELDDVLVGSTALHQEAWTHTLNELLASRPDTISDSPIAAFHPTVDYPKHIAGRSRLDGVRGFLASRGIRLPEGDPENVPGAPTVHGVANRKNEWLGKLLERDGVDAFDGVRHYLELAHDAGLSCAVVSASAHAREILERSGLAELVDEIVDVEDERRLAACRRLAVRPERAAVFETSRQGVSAALAQGFAWVVAVDPAGDAGGLDELRRAGANLAVRSLADLLGRAL